jgi:hypothetical protein
VERTPGNSWADKINAEQQAKLGQRVLDLKSKPFEVLDENEQTLLLLQRQLGTAQQDATKSPGKYTPPDHKAILLHHTSS